MKNLSHEEIASLCLELSLLLHAGVGLSDALALLGEEAGRENRALLESMARRMDEGSTLAAAMREEGCFPAYVWGLVEVALLYPAVMLGLMLVVIAVLLVKVLPIFDDVYASLGGQLTGIAGGLLNLGRWLDRAMPVLWVLLVAAAAFFAAFALAEPFRAKLTGAWSKSRGDKGISRKMNTARLAQAMSMGMASGLPMEEAVELAAGLMEDVPPAKARCLDCRARLYQGEPLSHAMKDSGLLPAGPCRLLELGQRSGTADSTMEKIAGDLAEESEAALENAVSRVEPALVLLCSLLVGLILLSVMLPLMHIMSAIG